MLCYTSPRPSYEKAVVAQIVTDDDDDDDYYFHHARRVREFFRGNRVGGRTNFHGTRVATTTCPSGIGIYIIVVPTGCSVKGLNRCCDIPLELIEVIEFHLYYYFYFFPMTC